MTEEERKLFSLYGKLPTHKNVLTKIQKVRYFVDLSSSLCLADDSSLQDRKYFDSGDYALSKAGIAPEEAVGTAIPNPQKYATVPLHVHNTEFSLIYDAPLPFVSHSIPHASPPTAHQGLSISPTNSTSPVKESALSAQDSDNTDE